ncbi:MULTISPECIES: GNAT family N-acetyltransferase [Asticcacaulis]|uniref:GNAT family N-acetyltransferase n=1 Tax=Asticcacaulis TaxID=76890 RepID=UPI001AEACE24|nr:MULTISPECIES: N-acetyltransferase [Asticcacaulis]MBP2158658.1 putative N-acetyltransferase YhbS [Asticcacaulis solisilvae]MDR6799704.1 putative N-acetyltransferase YhbS [Asticcacaulis sp. BE141]
MPLDSGSAQDLYVVGLEPGGLDDQILALTDRAFGPGRYVKTAERLREGCKPLSNMSFVALKGDQVVASVRLWPIVVRNEDAGQSDTIAFLGPIVVDSAFRSGGLGKRLIGLSLEAAKTAGLRAVLLVGDAEYFAPLGFERARDMIMPGPVDPRRVLIHYTTPGDMLAGQVVRADAV